MFVLMLLISVILLIFKFAGVTAMPIIWCLFPLWALPALIFSCLVIAFTIAVVLTIVWCITAVIGSILECF